MTLDDAEHALLGDHSLANQGGRDWAALSGNTRARHRRRSFELPRAPLQAGSAFANDKYEINSLTASRSNETRWGWMVGAGIEYSFSDNWSAKIEYYYLDFGTRTLKKRENFIWTSGTTFSVSTIIGSDMGYPADIGCVGFFAPRTNGA